MSHSPAKSRDHNHRSSRSITCKRGDRFARCQGEYPEHSKKEGYQSRTESPQDQLMCADKHVGKRMMSSYSDLFGHLTIRAGVPSNHRYLGATVAQRARTGHTDREHLRTRRYSTDSAGQPVFCDESILPPAAGNGFRWRRSRQSDWRFDSPLFVVGVSVRNGPDCHGTRGIIPP